MGTPLSPKYILYSYMEPLGCRNDFAGMLRNGENPKLLGPAKDVGLRFKVRGIGLQVFKVKVIRVQG